MNHSIAQQQDVEVPNESRATAWGFFTVRWTLSRTIRSSTIHGMTQRIILDARMSGFDGEKLSLVHNDKFFPGRLGRVTEYFPAMSQNAGLQLMATTLNPIAYGHGRIGS